MEALNYWIYYKDELHDQKSIIQSFFFNKLNKS